MTLYSLYIHFICDICEIAPPSVLWEPMENPPITFSWFRHSTFATAGEGQLGRVALHSFWSCLGPAKMCLLEPTIAIPQQP